MSKSGENKNDNNVIDFAAGKAALKVKRDAEKLEKATGLGNGPGNGADDNTTALIYGYKPGSVGVEVSDSADGTVHFTITAASEDVDDAIELAHSALARRFGIDPDDQEGVAQLYSRLGDQACESFVTLYVQQHFFAKAILRTSVMPFMNPDFLDDEAPIEFEDYTFRADALVRPQIELTSYEPVSIVFPTKREVTDSDIDEYLTYVARELASMHKTSIDGSMVGEQDSDSLKIDDAWVRANMPDIGTLADLRGHVRDLLEYRAAQEYEEELETRCANELAKRLVSEPGQAYLEKACEEAQINRIESMREQGIDFDQMVSAPDFNRSAWNKAIEAEARGSLRRGCALDSLADHLDIQLVEEDIYDALRRMSPDADAQVLADTISSGQMHRVCEVALRMRANEWLAQTARPKSSADLHFV